jgi:hypothetical protein
MAQFYLGMITILDAFGQFRKRILWVFGGQSAQGNE